MQKGIVRFAMALVACLSACSPKPAAAATPGLLPAAGITPMNLAVPTATREPIQPSTAPATTAFTLTSPDLPADGRLPAEYTCDGTGSTLSLTWNGAPSGTRSYALIMHHQAPEAVHWYWLLYRIPASVTSLPKNVTSVGLLGTNINNGRTEYSPPCSKGPGDKTFTYTVYALSAEPQLAVPPASVDRDALLAAIRDITLSSADLNVIYARAGAEGSGTEPPGPDRNPPASPGSGYSIEQAISDKAQGMTIAFDALAFLTGDLGADSFFPPGKVADLFGFQYLRDNDPSQMGHAGDFLTSASMNMLAVLTAEQRAQLVTLAGSQVGRINEYGYRRFVLMQAFQNLLEGRLPAGTSGLDLEAVRQTSADLYQLDGEISYERAQLYAAMINSFTPQQAAALEPLKGQGMLSWPKVDEPADLRSLDRDVKVAVMTYAGDMLSWVLGSVDADVYFCPERHGTYFGSFYLKDIRAMADPSYAIPTDMTGDLGDRLLATLDANQAGQISGLVDQQRPALLGMVDVRRQVSLELRKFLDGATPDRAAVLLLMRRYGEYDGEIIYQLATTFTAVNDTLTSAQREQIEAMRSDLLGDLSHPSGAYLYSQPIPMPAIPSTDALFK